MKLVSEYGVLATGTIILSWGIDWFLPGAGVRFAAIIVGVTMIRKAVPVVIDESINMANTMAVEEE